MNIKREDIDWTKGNANIAAASVCSLSSALQSSMCATAMLDDFLEFLFDKSGHLDHITYREAWKEFEDFNAKNNF